MPRAHRLVAFAPRTLEIEAIDLPDEPPQQQLLVRTTATLISTGTELANWTGITADRSAMGPDWRERPFRPGYSLSGVVVAVGAQCQGWSIGQRVTASGPHASFALLQAGRCVAVPETVSDEDATFGTLGPIVLNGVRRAKIALGESVAIVGLGLIGQLAGLLARVNGARPVVGVDPYEERRTQAVKVGLNAAYAAADNLAQHAAGLGVDADGFDVVIEATGHPDALTPALRLARRDGRVVALGSTRGTVTNFDVYRDIHLRGIQLIGAHLNTHPQQANGANRWTEHANRLLTTSLIASGDLPIAKLISHRFLASDAFAAFSLLADRRREAMGVVLNWRDLSWGDA